uniref:Uncharacterized protein n=1 Tax=Rhizophora mucronata TaxID=61149 RepID=A0A2P2N7T4_RHIMU
MFGVMEYRPTTDNCLNHGLRYSYDSSLSSIQLDEIIDINMALSCTTSCKVKS